jgi:pyruvate/2-oxoacid:ferredoxin oxidoreductase beta subunit
MTSLLNSERPLVFCPGCSHDKVVKALDRALVEIGLKEKDVAIVTDIGCSGLFDTFFKTHAFHGLHGRALTYATGLKMARPNLYVIVTMGDGGLGIGGAHVLSTCRRNLDLTLLIMNNFNYGMTGGQGSTTTPQNAEVSSGFLNRLEKPLDICSVAGAAGAPYVARTSVYGKGLAEGIKKAIQFDGFSLIDIRGACPGRYTRRNKLTPTMIDNQIAVLPTLDHFAGMNKRPEYGKLYREEAGKQRVVKRPVKIEKKFSPIESGRREVIILGQAGKRIMTAGELLCLAGISAGLNVSQKNDYPITVLRGHSLSEMILSDGEIGYTGIKQPHVVIALAQEGVDRRKKMLQNLTGDALVIKVMGVDLPSMNNEIIELDLKAQKIKSCDWALAALSVLAGKNRVITTEMLKEALRVRFKGQMLDEALALVDRV